MQKGLFSSLPSISNWPDRTDLSVASNWGLRNGLADAGDFLALVKADDGSLLWSDGTGLGPNDVRSEAPHGTGAALAATLTALNARCLIFARPQQARTLAALSESLLPPICADSALFHRRHIVDPDFGGRAAVEEGPRLASLLAARGTRVAVIGNQGVLTIGAQLANALSDLHRFERAAGTYLRALATGHSLRLLPDELAAMQPEPDAEAYFAAQKQLASV